ncbi:HugZ family protein [Reyranella sp. CPCC 100927]|nr:HugZ family protein [Reyranella sp. CPCC 100927]
MTPSPELEPAPQARILMRSLDRATLASALPASQAIPEGQGAAWPYASLVLTAVDHDLAPILLLSALAEHSKAIAADARVSLLFDGTTGLEQPLTGPRLTVLGHARRTTEPRLRQRFLARHPDAALYADFSDFHVYRLEITRAHLVAGFGRIRWVEPADLVGAPVSMALIEREVDIVSHMNEDHHDAIDLYATRLLGRAGTGWRMTGIDADGFDLRRAGEVARLDFAVPILDAEQARAALVALVKQARAAL